uniref:Uncharacterized protein n=1 Tax=Aegilops tauschii subsp. strangulata TaxID=200361 RepID=A0A453C2K8_AEGTS
LSAVSGTATLAARRISRGFLLHRRAYLTTSLALPPAQPQAPPCT